MCKVPSHWFFNWAFRSSFINRIVGKGNRFKRRGLVILRPICKIVFSNELVVDVFIYFPNEFTRFNRAIQGHSVSEFFSDIIASSGCGRKFNRVRPWEIGWDAVISSHEGKVTNRTRARSVSIKSDSCIWSSEYGFTICARFINYTIVGFDWAVNFVRGEDVAQFSLNWYSCVEVFW